MPNVGNKRSAAIGYGTKSDFTKNRVVSASPADYNKKSDFDKERST